MPVFTTPIPHMKTAAIDIELDSPMDRFPIPRDAKYKISCICLVGTDGKNQAFVLERKEIPWGSRDPELPENIVIHKFKSERESE